MLCVGETLSNAEENVIEEFQVRVGKSLTPAMQDDWTVYYRFLKARDFDLDKAENMIRKHIIWRKMNQIDTILEDFKPTQFIQRYLEPNVIGYDKEGNIAMHLFAGELDPFGLLKSITTRHYMRNWMWIWEEYSGRVMKESKKTGRHAYRSFLIADIAKFSLTAAVCRKSADLIIQLLAMAQDNYPEKMKALYIINAPSYFVILFSIMQTFLSSAVIKKIHIYGTSGWKEKLLENIDADILPAFLGGNRTDPDGNPMCKTFIKPGGKITEYYHLSDKDRQFSNANEVKKVTILARRNAEIHVNVEAVGSLIRWEFLIKGKDIGFGMFLASSEHKQMKTKQMLIPVQKYDTSEGVEKDFHKCRSTGRYTIVFDNSYSRMSSKEVEYCVTVLKPTT